MINFKVDINTDAIASALERCKKAVIDRTVERFIAIGSEALELALSSEAYHNITGNLRSSIGYGVFVDGEEVHSGGFTPIEGSEGTGYLGSAQGREMLAHIGSQTKGVALVLVAGSDHAAKVESEGKPVISDARLLAESLVKQLFV